ATLQIGLHSPQNQKRQTLGVQYLSHPTYIACSITLQPQTENIYVVFKDGWHPAEVAEHNAAVEWQWTKRVGTLAFKNPKKDCVLYLDVDHPAGVFPDSQHVDVTVNGQSVKQLDLAAGVRTLEKIPVTAAQFGSGDTVEVPLSVD